MCLAGRQTVIILLVNIVEVIYFCYCLLSLQHIHFTGMNVNCCAIYMSGMLLYVVFCLVWRFVFDLQAVTKLTV